MTPTLRARLLANAEVAPFRTARALAADTQAVADDVLLERLWREERGHGPMAAAETVMRVVAGQAPPEQIMALVERLRVRSAAHQRAQADALLGDGWQLPDAALTLRELSGLRYGVDPLISAWYARALDLQYPVEPPEAARGRGRRPADTEIAQPTAPTTPTAATKHTVNPPARSVGNGGGFGWDGTPQPKPV